MIKKHFYLITTNYSIKKIFHTISHLINAKNETRKLISTYFVSTIFRSRRTHEHSASFRKRILTQFRQKGTAKARSWHKIRANAARPKNIFLGMDIKFWSFSRFEWIFKICVSFSVALVTRHNSLWRTKFWIICISRRGTLPLGHKEGYCFQ